MKLPFAQNQKEKIKPSRSRSVTPDTAGHPAPRSHGLDPAHVPLTRSRLESSRERSSIARVGIDEALEISALVAVSGKPFNDN